MPSFDESFPEINSALTARYGRPATSSDVATQNPFQDAVAVLLDRALEARKVARAVSALNEAGLLEPAVLAETEPVEILETLKSAGVTLNVRVAGPLIRLARWLVERHHGSAEGLLEPSTSTSALREELSSLNGIGPATADAILLVALRRAVYPVDRATYRILVRHGWLDPSSDYEEARSVVERPCGDDPETLARLAHGFEQVGREFCRASVAKCERCPLKPFLPEGGPREPDRS